MCLVPSFIAPHTVVVNPDECQSKPSTEPKAWNQNGSDTRRRNSCPSCSMTIASTMAPASFAILLKSHLGARP